MSKTIENLHAAFAGESQANRKYLAFAVQAEKEGYPNAARLFRAAAEAETLHAQSHLRALRAVGSTAENLETAAKGETEEATAMYPRMKTEAETEGNEAAARTFDLLARAEGRHAQMYRMAGDELRMGRDVEVRDVYLCPGCGNIVLGKPSVPCEICGAPPEKFVRVP
jgi:rubrerythrin